MKKLIVTTITAICFAGLMSACTQTQVGTSVGALGGAGIGYAVGGGTGALIGAAGGALLGYGVSRPYYPRYYRGW